MTEQDAAVVALAAQVADLAERRTELAAMELRFEDKERCFYATVKEEQEELTLAEKEIEVLEFSIKAAAVKLYGETGATKPTAGVVVKLFDTINYDAATADEWSRTKGMFRIPERLDTKAFEKVAASLHLPFVQESVEPRATIAKELDKALAVSV